MKLAVMQPYFLPYLGYFQLIDQVDKFVILDDVQFIKSGWINRNYILHGDKPLLFTIPVHKLSSKSLIRDVKVIYDSGRIIKFLKTIKLNYSKSPFFKNIIPLIELTLENVNTNISDFSLTGIKAVNEYLGIKTEIIESSSIYRNINLNGEERILDICRQEGADEYFNLSGGIDLYSKELFNSKGIKLNFIRSKKIEYKQFKSEFTGPLSIIDNLMFNSPDEVKKSLQEFEIF